MPCQNSTVTLGLNQGSAAIKSLILKLICMAKSIQVTIYQFWQKSFRILMVTILRRYYYIYFVEFTLDLEQGS